jgi:hypothetical protein
MYRLRITVDFRAFANDLHHDGGRVHTIFYLLQMAGDYRPPHQSGVRLSFYVAITQRESSRLQARRRIWHVQGDLQ